MNAEILISSFYHFLPLSQEALEFERQALEVKAVEEGLQGLVILAPEGINGTIAGPVLAIKNYSTFLIEKFSIPATRFKESQAQVQPFRRLKIKLREEIVTTGEWGVIPERERYRHLTPKEWNEILAQEDVVLLDVRNVYETQIGAFENAIKPPIKHFSEFADFVRESQIPKDKKVLMYCTGGIRCEKALYEMERQGYEQVYQLDGGILRYLEEYPEQSYQGECFVFDHRVALDQHLEPSKKFMLCSHCGQPIEREVVERQAEVEFNAEALVTKLCGCYRSSLS